MTPILALIGAAILAATGVFAYFGSYWYQYWLQIRQTVKEPPRPHWSETRYCNACGIPHDAGRCGR